MSPNVNRNGRIWSITFYTIPGRHVALEILASKEQLWTSHFMSQIRSSKAHNVEYNGVGLLEHVAHSTLETKTFEFARGFQMPVRGLTGESSKQANKSGVFGVLL